MNAPEEEPRQAESPVDDRLGDLQERLNVVVATRDRMHGLLDAVLAIGSNLDLQSVLRRIVEAAVRLVDAQYGALGVIGDDGVLLSQFITVGLSDETIANIGPLPHGQGILGVLTQDPRPLRLVDLSAHPASYGFPANHPPMRTFLGVPLRVRDEVFGNLYITEKHGGWAFDEADESIVLALAAAAGVAVANARLYDGVRRREKWLNASAEVTSALMSGSDPAEVLSLIAQSARSLVDADLATIELPSANDTLMVEVADGRDAAVVLGRRVPADSSLAGEVLRTGGPMNVSDAGSGPRADGMDPGIPVPTMLVPLRAPAGVLGVLTLANRSGGRRFSDDELAMIKAFAGQAAVALELARQQRENERLSLFEDRDRIARDLHDLVIQRLFATGMQLESVTRLLDDRPEVVTRVGQAVDDLDETIREIRSTIYALHRPERSWAGSARTQILSVTQELADVLGYSPSVHFDGLVDTRVTAEVGEHVVAVLRESLSNTARHAKATHVEVSVMAGQDLVVVVQDDGVGLPDGGRRSGLANLAERAASLGGEFAARALPDGGTEIVWRVPLAP